MNANVLCEQLCAETSKLDVDKGAIDLARRLMECMNDDIMTCDRKTYVWIFTHATALAIQIRTAIKGKIPPAGEPWAEFISSRLVIH